MNNRIKLTNIGELATWNSTQQDVILRSGVEILIEDDHISRIDKTISDPVDETIDCQGKLVTPGFIDPHTHPIFYQGRHDEFAQRIAGATYQEIAAQGGGIGSSIKGVRQARESDLIELVSKRLDRFLRLGTTTIEAKSGYGLNTESELKSLRVIDEVNRNHPVDLVPTFLGAHAFPPEFTADHVGYVHLIIDEMIPAVAEQGIAEYCDVFCENGYFDAEQSRRILEAGKFHGLKPRLHADEFEDSGAAELARDVDAVSADHLMAISEDGIQALVDGNVIGTLLPGTTFFLGAHSYAPARRLLDAGVSIALATDFNPGSSHIQSMPFILTLACLYLGLTVEEAFAASTIHAARALQRDDRIGSIEPGKQADLVIWDINTLMEFPYFVSDIHVRNVVKSGQVVL